LPDRPVVQAADFERALRTKPCARTVHFLLHHVRVDIPAQIGVSKQAQKPGSSDLSTACSPDAQSPVDISHVALGIPPAKARACQWDPSGRWELGLVVPKRLARRAVTRNLIRHQTRELWRTQGQELADGQWVVRLRTPFDRQEFVSAASDALKAAVRSELQSLLESALQRASRGSAASAAAGS